MYVLEVALTDQCNLGCRYCYVKNRKQYLTLDKFDRFYEEVLPRELKRTANEQYSVSFFGGEPLLNFNLLRDITARIKDDPRLKHAVLVSNLALLTPEIVSFLKENNVGVSWSFDGLSSRHTRPFLDKRDPILVYNSLKALILELTDTCKVMISPRSVREMTQNAKFLKEFGIKNIQMEYLHDDVWRDADVAAYAKELNVLKNFQKENTEINISLFSDCLKLFCSPFRRVTPCFAGYSGGCLSTDGNLYPCQRYASNKKQWSLLPVKNLCEGCHLDGKCVVGCTYSMQEHGGLIQNVCKLHKVTFKCTQELVKECPEIIEWYKHGRHKDN